MPVSMNGEEKRYLILELSQEKEQHRLALERAEKTEQQLRDASQKLLILEQNAKHAQSQLEAALRDAAMDKQLAESLQEMVELQQVQITDLEERNSAASGRESSGAEAEELRSQLHKLREENMTLHSQLVSTQEERDHARERAVKAEEECSVKERKIASMTQQIEKNARESEQELQLLKDKLDSGSDQEQKSGRLNGTSTFPTPSSSVPSPVSPSQNGPGILSTPHTKKKAIGLQVLPKRNGPGTMLNIMMETHQKERESLQAQLNDNQLKIENLTADLLASQTRIAELETQEKQLRQDLDRSLEESASSSESETRVASLLRERGELESRLKSAAQQLEEARSKIAELEATRMEKINVSSEKIVKDMATQLAAKGAELQDTKSRMDKLQRHVGELKSFLEEEKLEKEIERVVASSSTQFNVINGDENMDSNLRLVKTKMLGLRLLVQELEEERKRRRDLDSSLADVRKERDQALGDVAQIKAEATQLAIQSEERSKDMRSMQEELDQVTTELERLKDSKGELIKELELKESMQREGEQSLQVLQKDLERLSANDATVSQLEHRLSEITEELNVSQQKCAEAEERVNTLEKERTKSLEEQITKMKEYQAEQDRLEAELERLNDDARSCNQDSAEVAALQSELVHERRNLEVAREITTDLQMHLIEASDARVKLEEELEVAKSEVTELKGQLEKHLRPENSIGSRRPLMTPVAGHIDGGWAWSNANSYTHRGHADRYSGPQIADLGVSRDDISDAATDELDGRHSHPASHDSRRDGAIPSLHTHTYGAMARHHEVPMTLQTPSSHYYMPPYPHPFQWHGSSHAQAAHSVPHPSLSKPVPAPVVHQSVPFASVQEERRALEAVRRKLIDELWHQTASQQTTR